MPETTSVNTKSLKFLIDVVPEEHHGRLDYTRIEVNGVSYNFIKSKNERNKLEVDVNVNFNKSFAIQLFYKFPGGIYEFPLSLRFLDPNSIDNNKIYFQNNGELDTYKNENVVLTTLDDEEKNNSSMFALMWNIIVEKIRNKFFAENTRNKLNEKSNIGEAQKISVLNPELETQDKIPTLDNSEKSRSK